MVRSVNFDNIQAAHSVSATFAQITWTVTVTQVLMERLVLLRLLMLRDRVQVRRLLLTVATSIASITVDGSSVPVTSPSGQTVSFNNIQAAHSISATFAQITWTVTVTQSAHGMISPATASYAQGSSPSETITPDSGY